MRANETIEMRVLLVEDDELIGINLCDILEDHGYSCDWQMHGKGGAKAIQKNSYDAVLLDANIPHTSGLELLKMLREINLIVPVIILTAQNSLESRQAFLSAGANVYLKKPFELGNLLQTIGSLINKK